jgi:(p)ppGpp synthase/HD superfamily hydrolase
VTTWTFAALLHDVLEDTRTGYDELAAAFGERVARIVQENSDDMTLPKPERTRGRLAAMSKKSREARFVVDGRYIRVYGDDTA